MLDTLAWISLITLAVLLALGVVLALSLIIRVKRARKLARRSRLRAVAERAEAENRAFDEAPTQELPAAVEPRERVRVDGNQ